MGKYTTDNMPPVLRNLINLKAESIIFVLFILYPGVAHGVGRVYVVMFGV
jgi:hypothetical protein